MRLFQAMILILGLVAFFTLQLFDEFYSIKAIEVENTQHLDGQSSGSFIPFDNNDKKSIIPYESIPVVVLSILVLFTLIPIWQAVHRRKFLTPIFYQSNNLFTSLCT